MTLCHKLKNLMVLDEYDFSEFVQFVFSLNFHCPLYFYFCHSVPIFLLISCLMYSAIWLSLYQYVSLYRRAGVLIQYTGLRLLFNATFSNISAISGRSVLLVGETGVPGENHRPTVSHWRTLSHNVVSSTPRHERDSNSKP